MRCFDVAFSSSVLASKTCLPQEGKTIHDRSACQRINCVTRSKPRKIPASCATPPSRAGPSRPPVDPQQEQLAVAEREAKQDLYAQLLDRKRSSQPSETSTSGQGQTGRSSGQPPEAETGSTELIFRLERRGEGWGEEIFPHLVVEQRPWTKTKKRDRNRSSRPKPWTVRMSLCALWNGGEHLK